LVCAFVAACALCVFPALAGAATFVVNTSADGEPPPGGVACGGVNGEECTLREAIEKANATPAADVITFAGINVGSQLRVEEATLPPISAPVTIEGDSAAGGTPGLPSVELAPFGFGGPAAFGLQVESGTDTQIEDLSIGGFSIAIKVHGEDGTIPTGTEICGNYLGVQFNGELVTGARNQIGVEVGGAPTERPPGTKIGGENCAGNVISGNEIWGIVDDGEETAIGRNRIGVNLKGEAVPNGTSDNPASGGVLLEAAALRTRIGGAGVGADTIAFNLGPGVLEEEAESRAQIRGDQIYGNKGRGILIETEAPTPPTIETATVGAGTIAFAGTMEGTPAEFNDLDFFASEACAPLDAGVGQAFLGEAAGVLGVNPSTHYEVTVPASLPAGARYLTVTSTPVVGFFTTSEFSSCFELSSGPGPTPEEPKPTPPSNPPPPDILPLLGPVPTNGERVVVKPEEGKVKIKLPGKGKFEPLQELREIPVGATIDATKGRVRLTSIDPDGTEQSAEFFGGVFRVKQKTGTGLVILELLDTNECPAPESKATPNLLRAPAFATASAARKPKTSGKLWGSGHGNFRTEGNSGSATVEGTIWLVEDRCNGSTFFRTRRGVVKVRDFVKRKTLRLPAGKTYLAGPE
jgi:CSLREA domain-containing protein